ncbi:unnamed protein product [Mucor hiemalis]
MGQRTSKTKLKNNNQQHHGSTVFGHILHHKKTSVYLSGFDTDEFKGDDNLLFKPFLYGLELNSSKQSIPSAVEHHNQSNGSRADSGFLLYEKNSQLWKDLMYIDQTYYNNDEVPLTARKSSSLNITTTTGDALCFSDIAAMCQSMYDLDLSKRGFESISPNISLLPMIRKLDLSYNYLRELPKEIGYLTQLEQLSVSHNTITFIPDTICHLSRLTEFNISHNQLKELTPFIRHLDKLQTLILGHNQLKEINAGAIINSNLALLDLSYNPITILPAEITQLPFLRRLRLEGCPLATSIDTFSTVHNPPTLLEICARNVIVNRQAKIQAQEKEELLTEKLCQYINSYKVCSHCHGPYFDSFVSRGRWIERNDIWIPLEYRLCSAHWSSEEDRIYSMFSATSCNTLTAAPKCPLPAITCLPTLVKPTVTRRSRLRKWNKRASTATTIVVTNDAMSPSSSTTTIVAQGEEQQHEVENPPEQAVIANQLLPSTSLVRKWKYKMKNNSTLFLKNHNLM